MQSSKSSRNYFEYALVSSDKVKIKKIIENEFDKFSEHNHLKLSDTDREKLRRLAIEQLSEYMSELSEEKTRWSLDGNIITVKVQTKLNNISKFVLDKKKLSEQENYRFIQKSNKWELIFDPTKKIGIPYNKFNITIYSQMFNAASTAAFYAIVSWFGEDTSWEQEINQDDLKEQQQVNHSIILLRKLLGQQN